MNVYLPLTARLPSEYQEVEYIESSGTQYINTGFIPSNTTKVSGRLCGNGVFSGYQTFFGARASWNASASTGRGFQLGPDMTSPYYNMMFGGYYNYVTEITLNDGSIHDFEMSQSGIYQDGVLKKTFTTVTFTSPVNLYIFALNNNGTTSEYGKFKLYSLKIYNNGTLIRDFVPCYRKSDSVIGLYDLVNSVFYTNAGTGTFSKGSDMSELKNAYIGKVIEYSYDFRNKSTSQIQADGWSIVANYIQLGANGISGTSTTQGQVKKTINLSGAKKCIFKTNLYMSGGSGNRGWISPGFANAQGSFRANGVGYHPGYGLQLNLVSGTAWNQFDETITLNGQYTSILEVDLVNNKASITLDGVGTITNNNADLSTFLDQQYINLTVQNGNSWVQGLKVTIEY